MLVFFFIFLGTRSAATIYVSWGSRHDLLDGERCANIFLFFQCLGRSWVERRANICFSPIRLAYGVLTYFVKAGCLCRKVARDAVNRVSDAFCL